MTHHRGLQATCMLALPARELAREEGVLCVGIEELGRVVDEDGSGRSRREYGLERVPEDRGVLPVPRQDNDRCGAGLDRADGKGPNGGEQDLERQRGKWEQ